MKKPYVLLAAMLISLGTIAQPLNTLTAKEMREDWKLLFDGKSGTGWTSTKEKVFPAKGWNVKDGILSIQDANGGVSPSVGDIITTETYSAFDFRFEFRLSKGANSGIKYYVTVNNGSALGLEYQLLDDEAHPDAKMGRDGNRTLASLYDLIPANRPANAIKPIGEWNSGRIVVYPDNRVEHYLNGVKVLEYVRKSPEFRNLVQQSKYKPIPNFGEADKGFILLQDHGAEVSFRNLKIRSL